MASTPVPPPAAAAPPPVTTFRAVDPRTGDRIASTRVQRICYRCDTRAPGEIFHGGFVGRNFESVLQTAVKDAVKSARSAGVKTAAVRSPVEGVPPADWRKPMLHPFAPGAPGRDAYEKYFKHYAAQQEARYRSLPEGGKTYAMFDIAPSTGVAVTFHPKFAPIFPIGRDAEFERDAYIYAVWIEEAVETYRLQRVDSPIHATVEEIVVQYIPFYNVLGAVSCTRYDLSDHRKVAPIGYRIDPQDVRWNPHVSRRLYPEVLAALLPIQGKMMSCDYNDTCWTTLPPIVAVPPAAAVAAPAPGPDDVAASATAGAAATPPRRIPPPPVPPRGGPPSS